MADLTVLQIQKLKPSNEYQRIAVSSGLYIGIPTSGDKVFLIRYMVKGQKQRTYVLPRAFGAKSNDAYISLADARLEAAKIKALAKDGIDYQVQLVEASKAAIEATEAGKVDSYTVKDLYDTWFETTNRKDGGVELRRYFNNDILPSIGATKLRDLEESHIRKLIVPIANAGANRKAIVTLQMLKQMFLWAEGRRPWKLLIDNPVINLKPEDVTQKDYVEVERERFLSEDEIKLLVQKLKTAKLEKHSEVIVWLCLSCGTRVGETTKARWENVDLVNGVWFIPEVDTKDNSPAHTVYLSDFSIRQFKALRDLGLSDVWCFPSKTGESHRDLRATTKQIGDRQIQFKVRTKQIKNRTQLSSSLVLGAEDWTPHDLRRTCSTMLQSLGIDENIIERISNHAEQNRIKRTYQRFDYKDLMTTAWARLGDRLHTLTLL